MTQNTLIVTVESIDAVQQRTSEAFEQALDDESPEVDAARRLSFEIRSVEEQPRREGYFLRARVVAQKNNRRSNRVIRCLRYPPPTESLTRHNNWDKFALYGTNSIFLPHEGRVCQ